MRVIVEDNRPGEILQKLPDIVRNLLALDAAHDPDGGAPLEKAWRRGEPDPLEAKFRHPVSLAMYRAAKAEVDAQAAALARDLRAALEG